MDPNAALLMLLECIAQGDADGASEQADVLAYWLDKGGFVPTNISKTDDGFVISKGTGNGTLN